MAFPAPPSHRLAWDIDGTILLFRRSNNLGGDLVTAHADAVAAMNSSMATGLRMNINLSPTANIWEEPSDSTGDQWFVFLFPEPMRIDGIFFSYIQHFGAFSQSYDGRMALVDFSEDTTNGIDGEWTTLANDMSIFPTDNVPATIMGTGVRTQDGVLVTDSGSVPEAFPTSELYRHTYPVHGDGIRPVVARHVKGLRFWPRMASGTGSLNRVNFQVHLYGRPDTTASNNFVRAWSPTLDQPMVPGWLAWEDHMISSSADKEFRVKNLSESLQANDITISAQDEYLYPVPSPKDQILFSLDGGDTWLAEVVIGALAPEAVSSMVQIRRTTPANALLGSWSPVITFDVGSWT